MKKKITLNSNEINAFILEKINKLYSWSIVQISKLIAFISKTPVFLYSMCLIILYYIKAFFYISIDIIGPVLYSLVKYFIKKIRIVFYKFKKQCVFFYLHVIKVTAEDAEKIEKNQTLISQRQKAPSLWLLKLDFLAFFSILNRIFSVLLIIFIFFFFSVIFIYNLNCKSTSILIFYILALVFTALFVHIGFSYFKSALIFDNFRKLISNNISNIKKLYIIIYLFLALTTLVYLIVYLALFHDVQILYFTLKTLPYNYYFDHFLMFGCTADVNLHKLSICFCIIFFFFYMCGKFIYVCKFIVNCENILNLGIHCVCFWKTFIIVKKIYCKNNVHVVIYTYPELIAVVAYNAQNQITKQIIFNPSLREQYAGFTNLIDSISEITYNVMYRSFDLEKEGFEASKFVKFMEDVYLYIGIRTYIKLYLSLKEPRLFIN
jgi:hypothetical protein